MARKMGRNVQLIDSASAVAQCVATHIETHPRLKASLGRNNQTDYFVSDVTDQFVKTAQQVLRRPVALQHVRL
jgi:glutamate racemase